MALDCREFGRADNRFLASFAAAKPGPISSISRLEALGTVDPDYLSWAKELVEAHPERFGVPLSAIRAEFG
jgi:hypothetical protein